VGVRTLAELSGPSFLMYRSASFRTCRDTEREGERESERETTGYERRNSHSASGSAFVARAVCPLLWVRNHHPLSCRFRAKREKLKLFQGPLPQRQGRNLALTVVYVPHSPDSDAGNRAWFLDVPVRPLP